MIQAFLLAGGLALPAPQEPPPSGADRFATPKILTLPFAEAVKTPTLRAPERLPGDPGTWQRPAAHPWLRLALGALANDSFARWEQDPGAARRTTGQPSWAWTRLQAPHP
ncbi:MAG TPA: hypothetical protein VJ570_13295 [Holophagaceae bacterium]|nr:hypothetical protein [Holophagaceae bacterium]